MASSSVKLLVISVFVLLMIKYLPLIVIVILVVSLESTLDRLLGIAKDKRQWRLRRRGWK